MSPPKLRARTLIQPWASLIAAGAKRWETRSWPTAYRGTVLIHAGQARVPTERLDRDHRFVEEAMQVLGIADWDRLPKGAFVAVAEITGCTEIPAGRGLEHGDSRDSLCGDWRPGRDAWPLLNVRRIEPPYYGPTLAIRGHQGIWRVDEGVAEQALRALL